MEEWTYSLRGFVKTDEPGLWESFDRVGGQTKCYARTVANPEAMTVDYHCAWDQGFHLWMIYLMRVVDAQVVLNKPGSVVTWVNCKHPFYDENPYPETAPPKRPVWVGDGWDLFYAGHEMEMDNLKAICEYRASHGLPIKPEWIERMSEKQRPTSALSTSPATCPRIGSPPNISRSSPRSERVAKNVMFRSPTYRHHVAPDETAVDMVERLRRR